MLNYQRVYIHFPMVFPLKPPFSYGFPIKPEGTHGFYRVLFSGEMVKISQRFPMKSQISQPGFLRIFSMFFATEDLDQETLRVKILDLQDGFQGVFHHPTGDRIDIL